MVLSLPPLEGGGFFLLVLDAIKFSSRCNGTLFRFCLFDVAADAALFASDFDRPKQLVSHRVSFFHILLSRRLPMNHNVTYNTVCTYVAYSFANSEAETKTESL